MYFSTFPLTEHVEVKIGGHYFAISTTEKNGTVMKIFQTGKFFLILEIDFPLRRNYTDSWHRNVWGTRIRLFIVPDDSVFERVQFIIE